jgi:diadenosine tetraphosphatase ApaH/serine/threonine PP2A family protein phosphatase
MLAGVPERLIVCGHTHVQFDRELAGRRLINAGAVGLPYERAAAAYWLSLGRGVSLRRTDYDIAEAMRTLTSAGVPDVEELVKESLLEPIGPRAASEFFENQAG